MSPAVLLRRGLPSAAALALALPLAAASPAQAAAPPGRQLRSPPSRGRRARLRRLRLRQLATTARSSASAALARSGSFRPLGEAYSSNGTDTLFAVNCLDKDLPRGQALWPAIAVGFETAHRTLGRTQAYTAAVCATWPVVTTERYAGPWDRRTSNTLLIVGTAYDPATPYLFAQRATQELGRARLLTLDGYGHTSILSSTCIDEKRTTTS